MTKGVHGSTYAGNPLAMSVGIEVIKIILEEGFLENVIKHSNYLWNGLKNIESKHEGVTEIRGAGLLLGIKTKMNNEKMSNKLIQKKLLCVPAADNIIRLAPPLIVTKKEIDKALQIIDHALFPMLSSTQPYFMDAQVLMVTMRKKCFSKKFEVTPWENFARLLLPA